MRLVPPSQLTLIPSVLPDLNHRRESRPSTGSGTPSWPVKLRLNPANTPAYSCRPPEVLGQRTLHSCAMHCQGHSRWFSGMRRRGIAACAITAGLLTATAGCGYAASHVTIGMREAAAHEAIPVAAEGDGGSLTAATSKSTSKSGARHSSSSNPGGPIAFGSAMFGGNAALIKDEPALGRKLAIVRAYYSIGDVFPSNAYAQHLAAGSTLLVSLDSRGTSYASIAAGSKDGAILSFLRAVNRASYRYRVGAIYVSFEHEPDSPQNPALGSPAGFVRAWDHVHRLAASAHLNWANGGRLHWALILIHSSIGRAWGNGFWPGAGEVDVFAVDGYNSYPCGASNQNRPQTPAGLFNSTLSFASSHGRLPVFISEWGSSSSAPTMQARFIQQMRSYVTGHQQIKAALYWDDGGPRCSYRVDGHASALSALRAMGQSAAMQGRV